MKHKKILILSISLTIFYIGCNSDDFTPFRNFENNYVVYCVLDNRLKIQFVELQRTFYPGMDKKLSGNTIVNLTEIPDCNYIFKDTSITGREDYNVFYLDNFTLNRGKRYRLDVKNNLFPEQYSEITFPEKYDIDLQIEDWTIWSDKGFPITSYNFQFNFLHGSPSNYINHMFIEFEMAQGFSNIEVIDNSSSPTTDPIFYFCLSVENTFMKIKILDKPENIKIKRGYLVIYSIDPNLYNYYSSERGYYDSYSIRLDRPYWTDMKTNDGKGIGLFGAICVDSFSFKFPADLIQRYSFIDAQNY
jgi:hypothetical protein